MQAKKNHHYVWAHYLRSWSTDDTSVHYVSQTGKIAYDSVRGLAVRRHFYKSQSLSNEHLKIIESISTQADVFLQHSHQSLLKIYFQIQKFDTAFKVNGVLDSKAEGILDALNSNFIENLHTKYESSASEILPALRSGDTSILQNPHHLMKLVTFIGHQMSRTSAFKETSLAGLPKEARQQMEGCWWFISYMFGMNAGASLYRTLSSRQVCLMKNVSEENFITADHPVVNVHEECGKDLSKAPEAADFYYPISPKYAVMINESGKFPAGLNEVNSEFVQRMNAKLSQQAEINIFGLTEADIAPYRANVGAHLRRVRDHHSRRT